METKPTATPKKRYLSHSQGYRGKTLSFKNSTKQSFSELPSVLQCKQSSFTCKSHVSNKSSSRSTSSMKTKVVYSNWTKLIQDLKILTVAQRCKSPILENCVQEKSSGTPVFNQGGTQRNTVKRCNTVSIAMQKSVSQQPLFLIKDGQGQQTST